MPLSLSVFIRPKWYRLVKILIAIKIDFKSTLSVDFGHHLLLLVHLALSFLDFSEEFLDRCLDEIVETIKTVTSISILILVEMRGSFEHYMRFYCLHLLFRKVAVIFLFGHFTFILLLFLLFFFLLQQACRGELLLRFLHLKISVNYCFFFLSLDVFGEYVSFALAVLSLRTLNRV